MPSLYLLRHAASDWKAGPSGDHGRLLNSLGREQAAMVGQFLTSAGETPDRVLCSSAARTQETLERASEAGSWSAPCDLLDTLYESSVQTVMGEIRERGAQAQRLLVVGHQPTISSLAAALTGGGWVQMGTATLVRLDFRVDSWSRLNEATGEIVWQVNPAVLGALGIRSF